MNQGLSLGEALEAELKAQTAEKARLSEAVAKQERKETGFAASIRVAGSEAKADAQSPAAPPSEPEPKREGFAAKPKFGGFNAFGGNNPQKSELPNQPAATTETLLPLALSENNAATGRRLGAGLFDNLLSPEHVRKQSVALAPLWGFTILVSAFLAVAGILLGVYPRRNSETLL